MIRDGKIWVGNTPDGAPISILPQMANRHGMIAGATGTGKTVTLKVLAESFSEMGVPVFLADVKGDLAGMVSSGIDSADIQERIERFGLAKEDAGYAKFEYKSYPATFWDLFGRKGIQLRTTISEMGPLLLARIMGLNELQSKLLNIAFKIADDNELLLVDTKDLKALINYINDHRAQFEEEYGKMSPASLSAIVRAIVALEIEGGDTFFGETALNITDWFVTDASGRGMIHILDATTLVSNGTLYSTFLLWMLSELFEQLPEVGDLEKPRMVFFFDEAHLLFDHASKELMDKIEQVVKLIRSKGIGIYFCTQNPRDIPDDVLAQLGNKVQHALHAYTPAEQKAVKAAAQSFRVNPEFDTYKTIMELGTGEAIVSFLDDNGVPGIAQKVAILPPKSKMGSIDEATRKQSIDSSNLAIRYSKSYDPDSAYEFLERMGLEEEAAAEKAKADALKAKQDAKEAAAAEKARLKEEEAKKKQVTRAAKSVGNSVAGTVGREVGKSIGGTVGGSFGKTLGGNLGASLGRGILSTLFRK